MLFIHCLTIQIMAAVATVAAADADAVTASAGRYAAAIRNLSRSSTVPSIVFKHLQADMLLPSEMPRIQNRGPVTSG